MLPSWRYLSCPLCDVREANAVDAAIAVFETLGLTGSAVRVSPIVLHYR